MKTNKATARPQDQEKEETTSTLDTEIVEAPEEEEKTVTAEDIPQSLDPKDDDEDITPDVVVGLLKTSLNVPKELEGLIPTKPKEAIKFMRSEGFKQALEAFKTVQKPNSTDDKTKASEPKTDGERDPKDSKPKTFKEVTPEMISDAFREALG